MIKLYDNDSDAEIGAIDDAQLEVLLEELVEETLDEYTWNVTAASVAALESRGLDAGLVSMLRRALGNRTSVEIRYEPD